MNHTNCVFPSSNLSKLRFFYCYTHELKNTTTKLVRRREEWISQWIHYNAVIVYANYYGQRKNQLYQVSRVRKTKLQISVYHSWIGHEGLTLDNQESMDIFLFLHLSHFEGFSEYAGYLLQAEPSWSTNLFYSLYKGSICR